MKGALVFFLSFLIWLAASFCYIYLIGPSVVGTSSYSTLGQLGDSFGIINSLLSALVVAGVYLTYAQQRETIELERSQIKDERNASAQKTIEDRFFKMLEAHQSLVNSLVHIQLGVEYTGKIALLREYERLIAFNFLEIKEKEENEGEPSRVYSGTDILESLEIIKVKQAYQEHYGEIEWDEQKTQFKKNVIPFALRMMALEKLCPEFTEQQNAFFRFFKETKHRISHYFSSLLSLLEFIDSQQTPPESPKNDEIEKTKKYYFSLIKAQLSPQEQALLFYYNRFKATPDEKAILENSGLFKDISSFDLIHPDHSIKLLLVDKFTPSPASGRGNL